MWKYTIIFIFGTWVFSPLCGQEIDSDSLLDKTYDELTTQFASSISDSLVAVSYANAYLKKARSTDDTLNMVRGYYMRLILDQKEHSLFHLYDTIIELSKNFKKSNFPATAYFDKGVIYHRKYLFKNALDNYLKAMAYNNGSNKEHMEFLLNQSVGLLKSRIDKNDEALTLTKSCYKYAIDNNFKDENPDIYYNVLFSLSNAYRKMNYLDSARVYNRLGLLDKNKAEVSINYDHFLMLDGILRLYNTDYAEAEAIISRALPKLEQVGDQSNMALGYYFLGKTQMHLKNEAAAIDNFKKVDSIFQDSGDIVPELTGGYQHILNYYSEANNLEQQLKYTKKLISVDSTLTSRYKYLNEGITNQFDIPNLIESKEKLIGQLEWEKKRSNTATIVLISGLLLIIGIAFREYRKRSFYKRRFEELVHSNGTGNLIKTGALNKVDNDFIDVPQEIVDDILENLTHFETNLNFIDSNLTLNSLARKLQTNSTYLSKVVNHYKELSFSSYIKQLRVDYAFHRLKSESKLRNFTIKAIASECGFKSAESFSKTFYKMFGIYPSYFIKELNKVIS